MSQMFAMRRGDLGAAMFVQTLDVLVNMQPSVFTSVSSTVGILQASIFAKQQNLCNHWFRLANPSPAVLRDLFLPVLVVWVAPKETGLKLPLGGLDCWHVQLHCQTIDHVLEICHLVGLVKQQLL